jgi:hypothetical protein
MMTLKELSVVLKPFLGVENGMEQLKWMLHPWLTLDTLPEKPEHFYALPASQVPIWHPPQMMLTGSSVIEMVLVQLTCQSLPQDAIEKVMESIAFGNSVDSFSRVGVLLGLDNYLNWANPGLQQHVRVDADPVVENVLQTMPINVDNRQKFKVRQDELVIVPIICCLVGAVACQAGLEDAIRLARRCWSQIFVERVQIQAREAYNPDQALKLVFESKVLVSHPKKRVKTQRIPVFDHKCKLHMVDPTQPLDDVQVMEAVESPVSPFDSQPQAVYQAVQPAIHQPDVHQTVQSAIQQVTHPAIHVQSSLDSIPTDPRFATPTGPSFPLSFSSDARARIPTDPRLPDAPRVSAVGNINQMAFQFAEADPQVTQSMAAVAHSIAGPTDPRLQTDQTAQPNAPTESDKPPEGPGNSKGKLKIVVDKEKWSKPVYTVHKTGPPHKPIFTCEGNLSLPNGEEIIVSSTGQTRKASEQWAATAILEQLERLGKISLPQ